MGLLDMYDDPKTMGLLSLGLRLMSTPGKFGQALGTAGMGAIGDIQALTQAKEAKAQREMQRRLMEAQIAETLAQAEERKAKAGGAERLSQLGDQIFNAAGAPSQYGVAGGGVSLGGVQEPMRPQPGGLAAAPWDTLAKYRIAGGPDLSEYKKNAMTGVPMDAGKYYVGPDGQRKYMPKVADNMELTGSGARMIPGVAEELARSKGMETAAVEGAKSWWTPGPIDTRTGSVTALARTPGFGPPEPTIPRSQWRDEVRDPATAFSSPALKAALQGKSPASAGGVKVALTPEEASKQRVDERYRMLEVENIQKWEAQAMAAGLAAPTKIAKFSRIAELLKEHDGGVLSPKGLQLASAANSFGIKVGNVPNKEAAEALSNEIALTLRNTGEGAGLPGAMSDGDRNYLKQMSPGISQTKEGRAQMVDAYVKILEREKEVAQAMRNYKKKYGQIDQGFFDQLSAWSEANPLFGGK